MEDSLDDGSKLPKFMKTGSIEVLVGDRISELPDGILAMILSRLTLKEAVGTSLLSHRWKDMWKYTTGRLDFEFTYSKRLAFAGMHMIDMEAKKELYIRKVNKILSAHKGLTIEAFRVSFCLGLSKKLDIDSWIAFALRKKVQKLELNLMLRGFLDGEELYHFPDGNLPDMSCLTSLRLHHVDLTSEVLENILSKCPSLEFLSITDSYCLVGARVHAPCLKHLEISGCMQLEILDISSAEKLISLTYCGRDSLGTRFYFRNVPNLVNISLGRLKGIQIIEIFDHQPFLLSQIRKLTLITCKFPALSEFPELKNVTELELELHDDLSCALLVEACPNLIRLSIQFSWFVYPKKREVQGRENCSLHKCLKVVELLDFQGTTDEVELATYILSNAPYLEKIIVNTIPPFLIVNSPFYKEIQFTNLDTYLEEENVYAKECVQQLAQQHSPQAELIIPTTRRINCDI